ncbi:MAG: tetratricopeptide repeat protein [Bacteroidetes bacterium]|nr:tetratricopeptide repeat protein [Bacteroidota bacterium]
MRSFIIYIALSIIPVLSFSQNRKKIDSLKKILPVSPIGQHYELLNQLAWEYRFAYPDSTVLYAQRAYALGNELKLTSDLARPLNYQGVALNYKGDRLQAYDLFVQALDLSVRQNDSSQIAHSNNNIGRLFFEQGILSKSYDYYIRAYNIFKKRNDRYGLAYTIQSLGTLQRAQKDYVKAEKNYLEAYEIRLLMGNSRDIMSAQMMLARLYQEREDLQKSDAMLAKADSIASRMNDELSLAEIKLLNAKNLVEEGKLIEAEQVAEASTKVIERVHYVRVLPEAMRLLGRIKMLNKKPSEAEMYFKSSLKIAARTKDLQDQMEAYRYLWKLAVKENNKDEAVEYLNQYLVRKDSIKDLDLARQVERLQFQLEIEKKDKENEFLRLSKTHQAEIISSQKTQNVALLVIMVCALCMASGLWYYSRKRKRTNLKLEAQNQFIDLQRKQIEKRNMDLSMQNHKLAEINHEKDMLMNIVAHDLKSPLARIMGLTNLLSVDGSLSQSQQEYVRLMKDVTQSNLDLIADLLDVNAWQMENDVPHATIFNPGELIEERVAFFQHASISKNIDLLLNHDANGTARSNAGYISRIIDNLLSNAIKFSQKGSTVIVDAQLQEGQFILSVKDNGPGFSEADKKLLYQRFKKLSARPTAGESSNGLGLAIVKTLTDRLNGKIELESEIGKGSEFKVTIPVKVIESVSV